MDDSRLSIFAGGVAMKKHFAIFIIAMAFATVAFAQPYTSRLGRFQVDQIKGCAPFTVTITTTNVLTIGECTPSKPCLMNFDGSGLQQNTFTFTYNTPGTYTLSVLYQSIGQDDITITVDPNVQPPFDIYACSANRVSIRVNDNNYDQYFIDFENDGTIESAQPFTNDIVAQYAYPAAGTYAISVKGRDLNSADNCAANVQSFTTRTTLPAPAITALAAVNATELDINFTTQPDIQYRLEIAVNNATTFQLYETLYGVSAFTADNLRVDDNFYCFRLGAFDPCTGSSTYSNVICSQNFDLAIQNAVNRLTWGTASTGINSITIQRNGANYTTIPGNPLNFNDIDIVCNTDYCYRLVANYNGGATSSSLEKCGRSFTTLAPPAINNVSAVVAAGGTGVELSWPVAPNLNQPQFFVFRSRAGSAFANSATVTTPSHTDNDYNTAEEFCYRIDYTDACGNDADAGITFCPIRLTGQLSDTNITTLTWTKYSGWQTGVQAYLVERFGRDGNLLSTVNVALDTFYVEDPADAVNQLVQYRVRAIPNTTTLSSSISNAVLFIKETKLYSPNAFTPNNDNLNDRFTIGGLYITTVSLQVFDRWGSLIYSSTNNEPWNGTRTSDGQPMPAGTYVWKAEGRDLAGRAFSEEGTVLLIRKGN